MNETKTVFPPGTFTPNAKPSPLRRALAAQTLFELKLFMRNGEQLLLNLFIPVMLLAAIDVLPLGSVPWAKIDRVAPVVMALAVVSSAFTGQAIAVAFDRRYGGLKRYAASGLARGTLILGKVLAVVIVVALQSAVIGLFAAALGWRPQLLGLLIAGPALALGTAAFAAGGLLLGGAVKAEIVLAGANVLWFLMLAVCGIALSSAPGWHSWLLKLVPSEALASALGAALQLRVDVFCVVVLAVWAVVLAWAARRWFSFV
ncbi:ABC-2 type transporter [Segniliparus rotundus DSM 44985]|uniref:ABC-2 type transporter n=1 Tax=Segniliparus rotundus (strain ATCC BAA-972 / CDC 1076 / CIP 108378 / DSM 44985 / JCM 13578) TaxID=640132 RepID=D6ZAP6_SEGRD|nr:ABC transporter permease [Segniliparus rotundus]ADG98782.1 ABC-2 type transporter [Segniliparus rotundus DSM 44985]